MRVGVVLGVLSAFLIGGGQAHASFPGDNGQIVVHAHDGNDYEFYDAFSPGLVNITNSDDVQNYNPQWNPAGSMMVGECQGLDGQEICTYDDSGNILDTLTDSEGSYAPTWNKVGNRVVFHGYDGNDMEIFKVGSGGTGTPVPITGTNRNEYKPEWSPNGRWIAFSRTVNSSERILRMRSDGTETELVTKNFRESFSWSPDSKRIIFDRQVNIDGGQSEAELFSIKPNGTDQTRLTFTEQRDEYFPEYSPDGKWLVFIESPPSGSLRITKMRLSTGERTSNPHAPGNFGQPTWQSLHP